MITTRIEIISYNQDSNDCKGKLLNGDIVTIDPFVCCAIPLSDEDYYAGKGHEIVGKTFILYEYTVRPDGIYPVQDGMVEV